MDSTVPSPFSHAFAGMIAMATAMGIGRFVYTPILPAMMDGIGLSAADAGLIASANYVGYLVGAILAAGDWGQGRERAIAVLALAGNALLAAAMAAPDGLWTFAVIRFLAGVASAFVMVFVTSIVFVRLAAAGRGGLQALHFGGVGVGIATSSLMVGAVGLAGGGWRISWLGAAAICAVAAAAVPALIERSDGQDRRPPPEPPFPRDAALLKVTLAYGLFGFGYIITATFLVAIVRQGEGGSLAEASVWLLTGLAAAPSVWLWDKLVRRKGLAPTYAVGCLVLAVGVAASIAVPGHLGPALGGILLGGTFVAVTAQGLQLGRVLGAVAPRRVLAMMTAAFGTGQIVGPIVAGFLADWTGSFVLPSLIAAAVLLVAAWLAVSVRGAERA